MSERRECKSLALVVEERLKQLRTEQKDRNAEEAVYVKVLQLLSETPRHLVTCNLVLEHAPIGIGTVEAARCSECQIASSDAILGYGSGGEWKFCPLCGSQIQNIERERSSANRLTKAAIERSLSSVGIARG